MENKVKLGVRFFSFRNQYPYEEALEKIKAMGKDAFDITASQTVPGYPWPSDEYIDYFVSTYKKHGMQLISYDGNIDKGIRSDRQLNDDEMFFYALNDITYAVRFGAKIHRIQWHLPAHVLEKLAPYCEMYQIKAGIEIHSPLRPSSPIMQEYIEMLERVKSPWIGLIPDFSSFADKPRPSFLANARKNGISEEIISYVIDCVYNEVPPAEAEEHLKSLGAGRREFMFMSEAYHSGFGHPDYEGLKRIMPYVIHVHGKFYTFDENGNDAVIPIEKLLPIIRDSGYDGYITSEYEGHMDGCLDDPAEMVGKQLELYTRILENG